MAARRLNQIIGIGAAALFLMISIFLIKGPASALTEISKKGEIRADQETVDAIVDTFNHAEQALERERLSAVMAVYSEGYQNRGLRKEETSRIWEDLFNRYDQLSSRHFFSRIIVDPSGKTATVTCTGALFGVPTFRKGTGAEPVQIDSWFEANHYLVLEGGEWRIVGHDPSAKERDLFGSAIHLLF